MKVGLLSFAHVHAAGYAALLARRPDVELRTADPQRPEAADLDTYEELFAWGPDAVIVTAENSRHRELTELAARHGADVLCEKPLATTAADAEAMIAACADAGVRLAVAYPVRFSPAYQALRAAVRDGGPGQVLAVMGANNGHMPSGQRAWFTDRKRAGGGSLMDHTVHIADLLDDLFPDARAVSVYAQANNLLYAGTVDVETAGLVTVAYDNGTVATIDCSWSQPLHRQPWGGLELKVVTERATMELDVFGQQVTGYSESKRAGISLPWGTNLDEELLSAFLSGSAAVADGESGLRSLRIALAGYASLRAGQPVPVG
jgi:predicted dehydrogenase